MAERLEIYDAAIEKLVAESIACSPGNWRAGVLNIACGGHAITYSLKNDAETNTAQISAELRSLCEALYVAMRNFGDDWSQAVISYFKKDDNSWGFSIDFTYINKAKEAEVGKAERPKQTWWRSLVERVTPVPPWSQEPEPLVKEFIRDYHRWNDSAFAKTKDEYSEAASASVEHEWQKLTRKFCPPDFKGQPISYGSDSSHDLAKEEFLSTEISGDRAVVKTRVKKNSTFSADHEYELRREYGRWFLLQLYYVDDEGRYPSL